MGKGQRKITPLSLPSSFLPAFLTSICSSEFHYTCINFSVQEQTEIKQPVVPASRTSLQQVFIIIKGGKL